MDEDIFEKTNSSWEKKGTIYSLEQLMMKSVDRKMALPMRITYNDKDYVYYINNSSSIDKATTELQIVLNGETIDLVKDDRKVWVQKGGAALDPEFVQALGRSVSLRFRM